MAIVFPPLPYDLDELEPYISKATLTFHYGKHHKNYVDTLNKLIKETDFDEMSLEDIIFASQSAEKEGKKVFNNAAQAWNHSFLWDCMAADGPDRPSSDFMELLNKYFQTFDQFISQFRQAASNHFGSGWAWLTKDSNDNLKIVTTVNAGNPLTSNLIPLLSCDVWEHAYYLDYQNERTKYVENFCQVINWEFVEANFERGEIQKATRTSKDVGREMGLH